MESSDVILYLLVCIAVAIGVFLLIRSIVLWYWRVNDIVKNQNRQIQLMTEQNALLEKLLGNIK